MLKHQIDTLKYEKSRCHWLYIYCHVPSYDAVYRHIPSYDGIPFLIKVVRIPDEDPILGSDMVLNIFMAYESRPGPVDSARAQPGA
jgi:hypothetical protein